MVQTSDVPLLRPVATQGESVARCATSVPVALLITLCAALLRSALGGVACWSSQERCFTANGVRLASSSAISASLALGADGEKEAAQRLVNLSLGRPSAPGDRVLIVGDEERSVKGALKTDALRRALSRRLGLQVTTVADFPAGAHITRPGGAGCRGRAARGAG